VVTKDALSCKFSQIHVLAPGVAQNIRNNFTIPGFLHMWICLIFNHHISTATNIQNQGRCVHDCVPHTFGYFATVCQLERLHVVSNLVW
jgi:hypothetical protein